MRCAARYESLLIVVVSVTATGSKTVLRTAEIWLQKETFYQKSLKNETRGALSRAHVPPTKLFSRLAVNKTILKPRVVAATGAQ